MTGFEEGLSREELYRAFQDPPREMASTPLWFWNDRADAAGIASRMRSARDKSGYAGFGIVPFGEKFDHDYLSEDYFDLYRKALETARDLGLTLCLYDEFGYPTGSGGAIHGDGIPRFANAYPDNTIKRLDKIEHEIVGPVTKSFDVPAGGVLMAAVAMERTTLERKNLTGLVRGDALEWAVPEGEWRVMFFLCVPDGDPNVDYLDPEAVSNFVSLIHEKYYARFSDYFGSVITGTFHDEPTLYRAEGRMWTPGFNERFREMHGFDPSEYYPALWYDIGEETAAARNYLFGTRAELYASGFPRVLQEWAAAHGIEATGHMDQEEVVNPVGVSGDLMLCFKHLGIPGIDKIGGDRPAEKFYKVVSSAACNWDKPLVMSETYGAMGDLSWDSIYRIAIDQYTKGINQLIPHAVWYDENNVTYKPELSWRHKKYADGLPQFNRFLSRLNLLLQNDGRHVADICVLYPIATMQGGHHFDGELGFYAGGVEIPEADYVEVGELLTSLGRDYTFLHPEVLNERCAVRGPTLFLDNENNFEQFEVMIVPGHTTIGWQSLSRIKAFFDNGGQVIATGKLPEKSAEFGHDNDVRGAIRTMFSEDGAVVENEAGGRAVFIANPDKSSFRSALAAMLGTPDVLFEEGKELQYIHKIKGGRDIYLFANLSGESIETAARLRGELRPELWDPHTGANADLAYTVDETDGRSVTNVRLVLDAGRCAFLVST